VAFGFDLFENVGDFAVGADDESRACDAHDFFAVHIFLFHNAVGFGSFLAGVGEQRVGEVELVGEFLLRLGRIAGDAEQNGAGFFELLVGVSEAANLYGAAGGVGFGVEKKDDGLAAKIFQRDGVTILVGQSEVRGFIIDIHGSFQIIFISQSGVGRHLRGFGVGRGNGDAQLGANSTEAEGQQRSAGGGIAGTGAGWAGTTHSDRDHD
jgi:hypothetical protein